MQFIELPEVQNYNAKPTSKPDELHIYLGKNDGHDIVKVNENEDAFDRATTLLAKELVIMKAQARWIDKVVLWISADTPMSNVNRIKSELQKHNILKVNYIHNQKTVPL